MKAPSSFCFGYLPTATPATNTYAGVTGTAVGGTLSFPDIELQGRAHSEQKNHYTDNMIVKIDQWKFRISGGSFKFQRRSMLGLFSILSLMSGNKFKMCERLHLWTIHVLVPLCFEMYRWASEVLQSNTYICKPNFALSEMKNFLYASKIWNVKKAPIIQTVSVLTSS